MCQREIERVHCSVSDTDPRLVFVLGHEHNGGLSAPKIVNLDKIRPALSRRQGIVSWIEELVQAAV